MILLALQPGWVHAQATPEGTVTGIVSDKESDAPLENATVALRSRADSTRVVGTTTHKDGAFAFAHVPLGPYVLECSLIGHASFRSPQFVLTPANPRMDRAISMKQSVLVMDEVVITSERSLFNHAIDRKVYRVDQDIRAKSGTASEILQNIPSVQVDIDGNVSLRGSSDVMILIDGKKSPLMGKSRADVLQQLPAGSIDRIEVITNPSARFTPEGTSGIINIVMKKGAGPGMNGDVTGHLGTSGRHNENLGFGYATGTLNLFANYSYRDDRRTRLGTDARTLTARGPISSYREDNQILMRPLVHVGSLGLSYHWDPKNTLDLSSTYFYRRPSRDGVSTVVTRDNAGAVLTDFDRRQTGYESQREAGVTAAIQHDYSKEDHQLRVEANASDDPQKEEVHFVEAWRAPAQPDQASHILFRQQERQGHLTIDYSNPVNEQSKLEAGYALELHRQDIHSDAESLDVAQQQFFLDASRTYRFKLNQAIQGVYGTYERSFGRYRVLGGLRAEYATVASDPITGGTQFDNRYFGLYPTLHNAYKTSANGEVQLNYSRRIRRPESDDLNPFPEFTDPYNMEAGNPRLKPESTHSVELGYRLRGERLSFFPSVYYRYKTDAFTRLTTAVNDSVFLRTMANLAKDQSAGFEPVLTATLGRVVQANLNGNVFYEQIDASNLGYSGQRSVVSWSETSNVNITPWKATMLQVSSTYRSARLTPQGDSRPSFGLNLGARQNVYRDEISLVLAVTDLLKTQRQRTQLDVAGIQQRVLTKRDSQIFYAGLTYHYGRSEKGKDKDTEKSIPYEDQQ
jgi:outer membrane receptor protein involved in Fe transport